MMRVAIYENPGSPYLPLLKGAGCELGDLRATVSTDGVDATLRQLLREGVHLTVGEFKGRTPVQRGRLEFLIPPGGLHNPRSSPHALARSGGSRSAGTVTGFDLAFVRGCAANLCVMLDAMRGLDWSKADWEGHGGGAALRVLKYANLPGGIARWFLRVRPEGQWIRDPYRTNAQWMHWAARMAGPGIPEPEFVSHEEPQPIARWMEGELRAGRTPHLFGFVSSAVRLCQAAEAEGIDVEGAHFTVAGEPFTPHRAEAFKRVGTRVSPRYGSVETGPIGYACLRPEVADDLHLLEDLHAMIQGGDEAPAGTPRTSLFITNLHPQAPFVMLNVSMGDEAELDEARCGCTLERMGWSRRIRHVSSFEKLTAGGVTLLASDAIRVLEKELPARFGGAATWYQLVEDEGPDGSPKLSLRVHPQLGELDEDAVRDAFLEGIGGSAMWATPGFLTVERLSPEVTSVGKLLHMHVGRTRSK